MTAAVFRGLFDDASLFPPAALAMAAAVTGHERHRMAWYRGMSGPFVCPDTKITELGAALTAAGIAELDLALVLPGGAASLDEAVDAVFADPRLRLRAVELPASPAPAAIPAGDIRAEPAGGDLAAEVASTVTALDQTPLAGAAAFIEVPAGQLTAAAIRPAAEHRYLIKLRTGGTVAEAFPGAPELAAALVTLADERMAFKCTAGLHHAVRHRAAGTGFEHHGFLNVLLATGAALDGRGAGEVAAELADTDPGAVAARVSQLDPDTAAAVRDLFTSFGTCSTDDPVTDLVTLGLVTKD